VAGGGGGPGAPAAAGADRPATVGVLTPKTMEIKLSLEDAIRWAVRKNLDVLAENFNLDIARRDVVVARATFDPFFNLGATYGKNRDPTVSPFQVGSLTLSGIQVNPTDTTTFQSNIKGLSPIGTTYQFSLLETRYNTPRNRFNSINPTYTSRALFTATQPLLKNAWAPYNTANVRMAENNIEIEREKLQLIAINTVFTVESAYWDLVFTMKNFESKAKALDVARENLRIDQKKVDVGTKAQIDVTVSEGQVARRKTEYDQAAGLLEDARDTLLDRINYIGTEESLKALGERPGGETRYRKYSDISVIPTTEPTNAAFEPNRDEAIRTAFVNRSEYRQSELQVKNQEIALAAARNQILPALDLTGSWSQIGLGSELGDSVNRIFDGDFYDWYLGVLFEVPLSNRGPRARYRNARDLLTRLIVEKQGLENGIVLQVDKAIRDIQYAYRAVVNLQRQVEIQAQLLQAERVRRVVGVRTPYDVALIENDYVSFQAQLLRAQADYQIAKSGFDRAVGDLLRKRGVHLAD
jgi:outer membrane protein TolC